MNFQHHLVDCADTMIRVNTLIFMGFTEFLLSFLFSEGHFIHKTSHELARGAPKANEACQIGRLKKDKQQVQAMPGQKFR